MHYWAEAAFGRRQLARSLRQLELEGFGVRDVPGNGDSAQQGDRLLVGPAGVFAVGFCTPALNLWRPDAQPDDRLLAGRAQATHRLAELASEKLLPELTRLGTTVNPLLTVIGPEQSWGDSLSGLPVVGPVGLLRYLTRSAAVLTPMQVDRLIDRVEDWLALRSLTGLHALARRHNVLT